MMLRNTTAVVLITLPGFMAFEVWHERDSRKGGGAETTAVVHNTFGCMTLSVWSKRDSDIIIAIMKIMMLRNTTAVVVITLGIMTFGV